MVTMNLIAEIDLLIVLTMHSTFATQVASNQSLKICFEMRTPEYEYIQPPTTTARYDISFKEKSIFVA